MMPFRVNFIAQCNTDNETIAKNIKRSVKYPRVKWGTSMNGRLLCYPPVAVCGGGPGLPGNLDTLRKWEGDIYAINDTAGYLSDQGIASYMYAIDCTRYPYRSGSLVKGALFASRVHQKQFVFDDIRIFDMLEDSPYGIDGGPTAVCRSPHLFLRMGYKGVFYFGCEGSFYDFTHVSGIQKVAFENMVIVRVGGLDYITNASLLMQCQYLAENMAKFPSLLINQSGGLIKAMLENPDTWEVVAATGDLKKQVESKGASIFPKEYKMGEHEIWQQQTQ